ncbi:hypothetical protein ACQEVG_25580 [Streptomyces sp. CA-135486]|uniref:hypothetical protein n=1 Tax=Streptomyces sp. CA-135486 TaxID=3240049 RepID=UPI003D94D98A
MGAKRKFLVTAVLWGATLAGLAGCSTGGELKAQGSVEKKDAVAAATTKASDDPFGGLSADQIADKAVTATKKVESMRMAGRVVSDGEPLTLDFAVDSKGFCTGKLGMKGGRAELRQVDEVLYMKGDEKFWDASLGVEAKGLTALLKGRWFKVPAGSTADMDGICDLEAMLDGLDKDKSDRRGMTRGPDAEVDGRPAATLVKKKTGGRSTTMYVAKEGKPYLLKVVKTGGNEPGTIVFSEYNKPVKAVAPPADQIVDLEKLGTDSFAALDLGKAFGGISV